ncbi:hypothetical protein, partial [Stenotrophomonas maltophilia]|uniref:hypothetical protein n=1 Tax=Stenotrophomonas maltophilia TaxID=40324 RepID=UPI0031453EDC
RPCAGPHPPAQTNQNTKPKNKTTKEYNRLKQLNYTPIHKQKQTHKKNKTPHTPPPPQKQLKHPTTPGENEQKKQPQTHAEQKKV